VVAGAILAALLATGAWWIIAGRGPSPTQSASIAVLPFANMSGGKDEEYFSDGMTEELINVLSRIEGLQVSARTSSFAFKGQNADVREVGSKLGVASVLEGSVRRAGDRVRIAVQLVDAANGYRLWSDSYDRQLADVFALQDEVARTVVATLRPRLTSKPAPRDTTVMAPAGTRDPEAYLLTLKARHAIRIQTDAEVSKALEFATEATRRDSTYADAYVALAQVHAILGHRDLVADSVAIPRARAAVERALQLNPDNPEARVALAQVLGLQRDFAGARRELDQALTLKPSDAWAHDAKAFLLVVTEGLTPTAIAEGRLAQRLDPLEAGHSHNLGMMLLSRGATTEAVQYFNQSIALEPRTESSYSALGVALAILGRHAEAEAQIRKALVISPTALDVLTDQAYVAVLAGKPQEARTILTQL
jgi:TolB-like protein/Flp pilus assembly protein TadD